MIPQLVPVDGRGFDWPRRVANAVNALLKINSGERIAALEADVADLKARVEALETP